MTTVKDLREKMARIATNARSKFDEIKDDTPEERAAEIEREFDAMMADHDSLAQKAERLQKLEDAERRAHDEGDPRRPRGAGGEQRGSGDGEITYDDAFVSYIRAQGNIGLMEPRERQVLQRGFGKVETRAQTTTDAAGGYTVPEEMAGFIVKSMAAWGPMYDPTVTMEMMTSTGAAITIPTVNDTSTAVVQHSQGTTLTDDGGSDVTFGEKVLNAYAYNTEWLRVSKELADDSAFNIQQFLGELLGERLGRRANTELTTGDGTGDPNGIVTASSEGVQAAGATSLVWDEIIDLIHSVDPAYRASPRTRFMFNDTTFGELRKIKDGEGRYLWEPSNKVGEPDRMHGYLFSVNQAMPNTATGLKSVLFGDFGKYIVRKVGAPMIGAIQDKDFWPGFGIAGYIRLDGELTDTAAVKHIVMA